MKKFFTLTLAVVAFINLLSAQTMTADEMFAQTKCTNRSCFEEFILTKGFTFDEIESDGGTGYSYNFFKDNMGVMAKIFFPATKDYVSVVLITTDKKVYTTLFNDFKDKKFKEEDTEKGADYVEKMYKSSNYAGYGLWTRIAKPKNSEYDVYSVKLVMVK